MLDPEKRYLLLDALRPPLGYRLDLAVGTSYSLDLLALMTAPVAFALFDRQRGDGSLVDDPIATLQALREYATRISLFCQAGQISVPPEFRSLLVYLEGSIHPVIPPDPEAIFHPKVWYIRYRGEGDGTTVYRLLCLSRNLTFDRSWDTILRLDGTAGQDSRWPELERFVNSLITMAQGTRPVSVERANEIRELGRQLSTVDWNLPEHFDDIRFWPLGDDGAHQWPFEGRYDRMLVISPFVTSGTLRRLTRRHRGSILVSRPEAFERLGRQSTSHLAERLVLSSDASASDGDDVDAGSVESTAEASGRQLEGLHAKTYVADAGWRARVWTGSANATDAAFQGNVEFLIEFNGRKDRVGVQVTIGDQSDRLGLRNLVEPYEASQEQPLESTEAELNEQRLDRARRAIGGLRFTVTCAPLDADRWHMSLVGATSATMVDLTMLQDISTIVRPVTLGRASAVVPTIDGGGLHADFTVSEPSVTPFFAITLSIRDLEIAFVVASELIHPPSDRAERVLSSILANRADLVRFLLLLLGNTDEALAAFNSDVDEGSSRTEWLAGLESEALLEPLIRTYARDPARLHDIERVLAELARNPDGESILPDGWNDVWNPIAAALAEEATR